MRVFISFLPIGVGLHTRTSLEGGSRGGGKYRRGEEKRFRQRITTQRGQAKSGGDNRLLHRGGGGEEGTRDELLA